ncbi:MAG: Fe-S-containing protein [Terriglobales bacterium]
MLQQLVITLREGVEAALMIAIALAYLRKIGRTDLFRVVYTALLSALGVSLLGAVLITKLQINDDRYEGWLMLVASIFVVSMVYWMARAAKRLKHDIENRLGQLEASAVGLFFFVFFMVLREGVETVLILSAVSLSSSSEVWAWLGSVLGLSLAVLFGVAFVKGSIRINLQRFFRITTIILIVIAGQLMLTGIHELSEAGVFPSSRREMALVGPIVRNDVFFFVVILGLAGLLLLRQRRQTTAATVESTAARRKSLWEARRERLWSGLAYTSAFLFLVLIAADYVYARSVRTLSPAIPVTVNGGDVRIPLDQVADGNLHRYVAATPDGPVRFFAVRRPDGSIATALDACMICGAKGYYQNGAQVYCRNCDAPVNIASLGIEGGCNPIPLGAMREGGELVIPLTRLTEAAPHFKDAGQ